MKERRDARKIKDSKEMAGWEWKGCVCVYVCVCTSCRLKMIALFSRTKQERENISQLNQYQITWSWLHLNVVSHLLTEYEKFAASHSITEATHKLSMW